LRVKGRDAVGGGSGSLESREFAGAHGTTVAEIIEEYEGITQEDIQVCLLFATRSLENTTSMPLAESA
jgi:hypothetical protein